MEKNADGKEKRPLVGLGVLIENEAGEMLLGQRRSSHGTGEWSFPGGHLEFGETVYETAKREVFEETGLVIDEFEVVSIADEMRYIDSHGKHYLNLGLRGRYAGGEPRPMEPEKCSQWHWFSPAALPENLFESTGLMIRNLFDRVLYRPDPRKP